MHVGGMIVALAGGVGGSKLVLGLASVAPPERLAVIVNTGDDEEFYGLRVCPDLDTVLYTLSGLVHPAQGWGLTEERFDTLEMLQRYGAETWFRLGNRDLATHLLRSQWLREGLKLTEVTARLAHALGVAVRILPMTDEPVATRITIEEESSRGERELAFQEYFVQRQWRDSVRAVRYAGIEQAQVTTDIREVLEQASAIVFCPSNPLVSIEPILSVPGLREAVRAAACPRIAVSPIIGDEAVSGPAARLMADLGRQATATGVAALYADCLTHFVLDIQDESQRSAIETLGLRAVAGNTIMKSQDDKAGLARLVLSAVGEEA